jgi:hemerythrin-like domain-containing protein
MQPTANSIGVAQAATYRLEKLMITTKTPRSVSENDAITLLKRDHKIVDRLFALFDEVRDRRDKKAVAHKLCRVLAVHMAIEEELLYPSAHKALQNDAEVNEAEVEHMSAKVLIADIDSLNAADEKYDATVAVLGEYIRHHVKEEETSMFPQLRQTNLDFEVIGAKLAARRLELLAQEQIKEEDLPTIPGDSKGSKRKNRAQASKADSRGTGHAHSARERRVQH